MYFKWEMGFGIPYHVQAFNKEGDPKSRGYWLVLLLPTKDAYIYYTYTRPKYRRMGIADATLKELKSKNYKSLRTGFSASTDDSRRWFLRRGFAVENNELVWHNPHWNPDLGPRTKPSTGGGNGTVNDPAIGTHVNPNDTHECDKPDEPKHVSAGPAAVCAGQDNAT
jgi:GNAT superfamily N-acetyltransferase